MYVAWLQLDALEKPTAIIHSGVGIWNLLFGMIASLLAFVVLVGDAVVAYPKEVWPQLNCYTLTNKHTPQDALSFTCRH